MWSSKGDYVAVKLGGRVAQHTILCALGRLELELWFTPHFNGICEIGGVGVDGIESSSGIRGEAGAGAG